MVEPDQSTPADVQLPAGTPDWISLDLLAYTIQTWQPKSIAALTPQNAVEILTLFGQLFEAVGLLNPTKDNEP